LLTSKGRTPLDRRRRWLEKRRYWVAEDLHIGVFTDAEQMLSRGSAGEIALRA